jgi:DNA polymerase-3 subunit delta
MQIRADQLPAHLARGLKPLYVVHGDEALLVQEAADAIRAAARAAGHTERQVHTVSGAHFNWSGLIGASQSLSLFADRQLVEIRIPGGKPGKDGSEALQRYCGTLGDAMDTLTLVLLPRLDRMQLGSAWFGALDAAGVSVRIDPVERAALPAWIARRLAAQGQRVAAGDEGERSLGFIAERVEGNLLAAHQELQKLALLEPPGEIGFERIEAAVLDVARFEVGQFSEAALGGRLERIARVLDGLRAEGESPVRVHWQLAEDIRVLHRLRLEVESGTPLAVAVRGQRLWGARERLVEAACARLTSAATAELLHAAVCCDAIAKGLKIEGWPTDPWQALARLAWSLARPIAEHRVRPVPGGAPEARSRAAPRPAEAA